MRRNCLFLTGCLALVACAEGTELEEDYAAGGSTGFGEGGAAPAGGSGGSPSSAGTSGWSGDGGTAPSGGADAGGAVGEAGRAGLAGSGGASSGGASGADAGIRDGGGAGGAGGTTGGAGKAGTGGASGSAGAAGAGGSAGGTVRTVTLDAASIEDSYANDGAAAQNFGSDALFRVDGDDSGDVLIALVKPTSLGAVPTDGSARIVSAKLEMYCIDGNGGSEITVTLVTSAWTEAGVNWSNQPTVGTTVGTFAPRCGDALESVDITAAVTAWAGGAPVYGLRLKASDTNGSDWRSTEDGAAAKRPRIVITYN